MATTENGEKLEWLVTNGIGGYACGTLSGIRTRVYHGLLVAAEEPPVGRQMVVPGLDERAKYRGQSYELSAIRWEDGTVAPAGHRNATSFRLEGTVPVWQYHIADALIERRLWMVQGQNETRVTYSVLWAAEPVMLSVKVFSASRDHHASSHGRPDLSVRCDGGLLQLDNLTVEAADGLEPGAGPALAPWHAVDEVYRGSHLATESYRGLPDTEDLFAAAETSFSLASGQSLTLRFVGHGGREARGAPASGRAGVPEARMGYLLRQFMEIVPAAEQAPPWVKQLVLAADQFIVDRALETGETGKTIIAGYPWFGDWGRDTMISLGGIAIVTGRYDEAAWILRTFGRFVDRGMLPNLFPDGNTPPEYNTVDAALWFFEATRHYLQATDDEDLATEVYPILESIVNHHIEGTRFGIGVDPSDGLLRAGEDGVQLTWMDARIGDWVVTPRTGKAVEINALWHHALVVTASIAERLGRDGSRYLDMAAEVATSFSRFFTGAGLADVIDGPDGTDGTLRPNQVFSVSLAAERAGDPSCHTLPLLSAEKERAVVDQLSSELLTPVGLRSLGRSDKCYAGHYGGSPAERDSTYHQGPAWGWLLGPFIRAHVRAYGQPEAAHHMLEASAELLTTGCLGQLSEIYDGDPPHHERGAFAQAWTVAETLKTWVYLLEEAPLRS